MSTAELKPFLLAFEVENPEGLAAPKWAFMEMTSTDVEWLVSLKASILSIPTASAIICNAADDVKMPTWAPFTDSVGRDFAMENRSWCIRPDGFWLNALVGLEDTLVNTPVIPYDEFFEMLGNRQKGVVGRTLRWLTDSVLVCANQVEAFEAVGLSTMLFAAIGEEIEYLDGGDREPATEEEAMIRGYLPSVADVS